jgi:UDP-glucose 4-epimerase
MKNILVTGNSGYIGSHLTKRLHGRYHITGLDLKASSAPVDHQIKCDITQNISDLPAVDTIIHLAARVRVNESVRIPEQYYRTNLFGTMQILQQVQCQNFVFASTGCAEYCNNAYAISKRAAEDVVIEQCQNLGINYTIFRFYNVVGSLGYEPTNPDGLFYNLMRSQKSGIFNIFGNDYHTRDGTAERDYVHVDEIGRAIETAIDNPANGLENLGHGCGYTVKEIAELYQKVNGIKFHINYLPRRSGDLARSVLDNPSDYMLKLYELEDLVRIPDQLR